MISILVRCSLLVGITVCLAHGTSGTDIENEQVLSAPRNDPINKLEEGAVKFHVLKREAVPEAKGGKNGKNKKDSMKKGQRSKKGGKKKNAGKKNKPLRERKGKNKQIGKNGKNKKAKPGKRRNKQAGKNGNKKQKNKNKPHKTRKSKKKQLSKKEKNNNNVGRKKKTKGKGNGGNSRRQQQFRQDTCVPTVAESMKINRKYLNHERKIKRTKKWLTTITNKGSANKRKPFEEDADWLASVTNNGTDCPGDNTANNTAKVIEHVAGLKACASDTGPIAMKCNISVIPNVTALEKDQEVCITGDGQPPYTSYQGWIDGVTLCFEKTPTCQCFTDMNGPNNAVSNLPPHSCQFPNNPPDWINEFNKATNVALKACKAEVKACKDLERQACELTSMCCAKATDGGTMSTAASGRRMKIKASMIKKLHKMNIH